jgi:DNA-binding LacI/PurR family transcriptional regulator
LGAGDRLPSIRELSKKCNTSFGSARLAVERLEQMGVVERFRGSGTYLRDLSPSVRAKLTPNGMPDEPTMREPGPKTATIGVVVHDMTVLNYPVTAQYLSGIHDACLQAEYHEQIFGFNPRVEHNGLSQVVQQLDSSRLDGVILLTWLLPDENIAQLASRMPVVTMSRLTTMAGVAMVTPDQVGSTVDAVEHLLGLGHRKIVMVTVPPGTLQGWQHREGLRVGMRHAGAGAQSWVLTTERNMTNEWVPEFKQLLSRPDHPTAAIFGSIELAGIGREAAREVGLSIPRDLSIVSGSENLSPTSGAPATTSIRMNLPTVGRDAVNTLVRMIDDPSLQPEPRFVPTELLVRESTAPAPSRNGR